MHISLTVQKWSRRRPMPVCHDGPVASGDLAPGLIGRRAFLGGLTVAGALSLTGCSLFGGSQETRTVIATAPPPIDPIQTLIATTRLHLARIDGGLASIAADAAGVALLTPVRADRAAHLNALLAEQARTDTPGSSAPSAADTPRVSMPADPGAVISLVRSDAENAQVQFADGVAATGRYRAALFASIAACLATHRSVLV
jgi:hypothetical protein